MQIIGILMVLGTLVLFTTAGVDFYSCAHPRKPFRLSEFLPCLFESEWPVALFLNLVLL